MAMPLGRTIVLHSLQILSYLQEYDKVRVENFPELGKINYIRKPIGNAELVQIVYTIITVAAE